MILGKDVSRLLGELFDGKVTKDLTSLEVENILLQNNVYPFFEVKDNRIVGMAILYTINLLSRKLGVIEEVVTLKKYRGRGIGTSLIKAAIRKAQDLGLDCLELNVREDRPEVQRFYSQLGFYDRRNRSMRLWLNE